MFMDGLFYRHVFTCQKEEIAFDSESSDENSELIDFESSSVMDHRVESKRCRH